MRTTELKKRLGERWNYYATDWDRYKLDSEIQEAKFKRANLILILYVLFCLASSFLAVI